ncbi:hypothetical protein [Niabella terrae]
MSRCWLILICTTVGSSRLTAQPLPKLGVVWTDSIQTNRKLLHHSGNFVDMAQREYDSCKFIIGLREGRIISLSTRDSSFAIGGKRYIGRLLSSFAHRAKLVTITGWGAYLPLEQGWYAGFAPLNLSNHAPVIFLFRDDDIEHSSLVKPDGGAENEKCGPKPAS